jgi:hypothetical protein
MNRRESMFVWAALVCACLVSPAAAQSAPPAPADPAVAQDSFLKRLAVDVALGFDNTLSGSINSGAIGTIDGQAAVITPNAYEDVFGSGFQFRVGVGYPHGPQNEIRASFTWQSADADLTRMGDLGVSNLYGQYDDWKSWGFDVGYRKYFVVSTPKTMPALRPFVEGSVGFARVSEIGVVLSAPSANRTQNVGKFYDASTAFTFDVDGGVLIAIAKKTDLSAQLGLRHVTGLSRVDKLIGTGLDGINDDSARWSLPVLVGIRQRF